MSFYFFLFLFAKISRDERRRTRQNSKFVLYLLYNSTRRKLRMKNLSEKIGYYETFAVRQAIQDYEEKYNKENPYYIKLKEIADKQDAGEIVTDDEYKSIPISGIPNYWSAAAGYYLVNFHYAFFNKDHSLPRVSLLYKFLDFLANINFALCRETEVYNWLASFTFWSSSFVIVRPDLKNICDFIEQILGAVNPIKHNEIDSLLNIDRNIAPDVFDNAVLYFKTRDKIYAAIEQQYADVKSLKAKDVMEILNISRRTLSRYVEAGTVLIDSNINGKYRYNKESVFKLLRHNKIN